MNSGNSTFDTVHRKAAYQSHINNLTVLFTMSNFKAFLFCLLLTAVAGAGFGQEQNYSLSRPQQEVLSGGITGQPMVTLHLHRQQLTQDIGGHNTWKVLEETKEVSASELAIVICDMWDQHWSRGAAERVAVMAPRMNKVVNAARELGVTIIHAPSETMKFYEGTPARNRVKNAPYVEPPTPREHDDPPLPIDASDGGSDTNNGNEITNRRAWTRQIEAIEIDQERDGISDNGREIYSFLQQKGIRHVILMGVHTNMCILNRSFAIKQMVRWSVNVMLCRDLTDAMYNPAKPPYVSHDEGTQLVVEYIEKFWCPSISSKDLLR